MVIGPTQVALWAEGGAEIAPPAPNLNKRTPSTSVRFARLSIPAQRPMGRLVLWPGLRCAVVQSRRSLAGSAGGSAGSVGGSAGDSRRPLPVHVAAVLQFPRPL